jgi:hypothetical protein
MSGSLFNQYIVKGNLKFFKNTDNDQKITIGISISTNHQLDEDLNESIEDFLEKLLIADYINEDAYNSKKEFEKLQKKQDKEHAKSFKELEKKKLKAVKTGQADKVVKKKQSVSVY